MTDKVHFAIMGPDPTDADIDDFLAALGVEQQRAIDTVELRIGDKILVGDRVITIGDEQLEERYSPDQPRVPAGSEAGGEWTSALGPSAPSGIASPSAGLWTEAGAEGAPAAAANAKIAAAKAVAERLELTDEEVAASGVGKEAMERYNGQFGYPQLSPKEALVAYMHDRWAASSGDGLPSALALQQVVDDEFNLSGNANPTVVYHYDDPATAISIKEDLASNEAVYRAYARAEYENTQAFFKAKGITDLTLYRGIGVEISEVGSLGSVKQGSQKDVSVQTNPLSSWSASEATAANFASWGQDAINNEGGDGVRFQFSATVPVGRVFSTPMTGAGCLDEYEAVILGGTDTFSVYSP